MTATSVIYAILAGLVPSLIWLFFWLREDNLHPEPRFLISSSFLSGMIAVMAAVFAEKYIADLVVDPAIRYTAWAAVEEIFKFIAVALVALHTRANNEPIDAMIYCIAAALGFAALENTLFILGPLSGGEIVRGIITGNMRFMGATLVHVVSSATIGFALGFAFYRGRLMKIVLALLGIAGAIALHAAFNLSIIDAPAPDTLKTFAWVWGAVVILIILFEEIKAVRPRLV